MKHNYNDYSIEELNKIETDLEVELRNVRFKEPFSLENPAKKRHLRRDIARVKTILNEYKLGIRKPKSE